jgi:hypothetical protein
VPSMSFLPARALIHGKRCYCRYSGCCSKRHRWQTGPKP